MSAFTHAISKKSIKLFLSSLSLALLVFIAGCSGGGGGGGGSSTPTDSGSTEEKLTSMSQLEGAYKLKSVTTSSGDVKNVESLEIYAIIDSSNYVNFGKGKTCFTLSTIVSETVTDSGLEVTLQPQEAIDGVPYCGVYLAANLRSSSRSSGHTARSKAQEADGLPPPTTGTFGQTPDGYDLGFPDGTTMGYPQLDLPEGPPKIDPGESMADYANRLNRYFDDLDSGDDNGDGDGDDGAEAPTEPPSATLTCTDLGHGTGESYLYMCVLYKNVPAGTQAKFTVSGGGGVSELTVDVQPSGWACVTATIYSYGDYSWRAEVETAAGSNTTTGDIKVGSAEQKNCTQ